MILKICSTVYILKSSNNKFHWKTGLLNFSEQIDLALENILLVLGMLKSMYLFIVSFHVILLKQSSRNVACSTHQAVGTNSLLYCHYTRDKMSLVYLNLYFFDYDSVHFSPSVVSDSLRPHGLQHTRPPCPSSTPRVYSNSCPLSRWCHPTISSSVVPFSSHLQYFPLSGSLQMSQLFASGVQIIGVSASTPVLPMNI